MLNDIFTDVEQTPRIWVIRPTALSFWNVYFKVCQIKSYNQEHNILGFYN